jgi:hypothetical protein
VSTAITQIRERVEEILENITPDVTPAITLRKWLGSRDITTAEHTGSAAQTTRQFQVVPLPVRDPGFLGGGSVDQWQILRITIRYYMTDRDDGWVDVHDLAAADSAAIYEALLDDTQWVGTQAEGAALGDAVPLTASPTISNIGFQVLHYRVLYNRCDPGEGGKWARNFTSLADLTTYLLTQDLGTIACLVDSDRNVIQIYQRTSYGVEELNVATVKGPVPRATASLPQSTSVNYFTVSDSVRLMDITLTAETAFQAQANNLKWTFTPTGGSAKDLCAVVDVNGAAVGSVVSITGTLADAAVLTQDGATEAQAQPILLEGPGIIALVASASSTGTASASLLYVPAVSGATITAL